MYRTRKRVRDEGVASSVQQSRAESSRIRNDGVASMIRKSRAESSIVRDDGIASRIRKSQPESFRVRDDGGASSIRKSRGETPRGPQQDHSSFRDDDEEVYPRQDISSGAVNDRVYSAILETIKSILPEVETSQKNAHDKTPARPPAGGGIFWKDKSDLEAFRDRANEAHASRYRESDGEYNSTEALHKRLERLEQLLMSSQTASVVKQQQDHHNDILMRLLGLSSDAHQVRLGQGNIKEIHRPANISRVLEEVGSQVQARYPPRSQRNIERETFAPPRISFPFENSRELLNRGNVADNSKHASNHGVRERTACQVQSSSRAPSHGNLEPQISSRLPNSLSVVDALEVLLSGSITGNGRREYGQEDISRIGSQFQASHQEQSQDNLEREISSPPSIPLAMEDSPEELIAGNMMGNGKQAKIHKVQSRGESQVRHENSDSQMSSFPPNSLPTEDFLEEGVMGNTLKNKWAKVHKTQGPVDSQLQGTNPAQVFENSDPQLSAAPLNSLHMEDSPELLRTDFPIQTLHPAQSHEDSDPHISSHQPSPKSREESLEMLVTGYVMENRKRGKIRKAKCQPRTQVQDTVPLNSLPMEGSLEVCKKGKRGRGCTRLDDVWNMPEGECIICEFNEQCQPVKAEGRLLTRFIGTVVRKPNLAPLDFKGWKQMPQQKKEEMLKIVESKFLIPDERKEEIRAWIIQDLADKWRNYKCILRGKYYDESKPLSELVKLRPPTVDNDQWIGLLNLWNSPKWKRMSEVNKKNRENGKINHTSGTLSFAMVEAEMKEKNGVAPTLAQVYEKTHRHKDGTDVNEETAKAIEDFEKFGTRDLEADEVGNTLKDGTYGQYYYPGKLGRMRGKRKGPNLWSCGRSKRLQTVRISREEYRSTLQQQKSMKEQLRAQEERLKGLENKMGALLSTLQENLPQQDLVNILKKATQAEVPSDSAGSDPEYLEPL
ncbi:uncharacterized protein LOC116214149 [Punica granatum]|uniref:Uncharacterized protein LOC116214149 n=1 Tax=Punica granatum TaxID=22663 RepID=A0A6P8E5V8_PUNGR|nr:uncharacterized protein LOC116214149 [Punica granatum]